jgi:hypothetical protein
MFKAAFARRGLAPVVLSRTVGDTTTSTSALSPWNSCGAYMAATLHAAHVSADCCALALSKLAVRSRHRKAAGSMISARFHRLLVTTLLTSTAALLPLNAHAWGSEGHHLIADVAESQLSVTAKAEVNRLLALEPGSTLASISTWADDYRSPPTAAWHYVNLPRDGNCQYKAERSCVNGSCVVGAIERQVAVLASNSPDEARLKALKYVVHFVADVHQPLHAGFADDKGGNAYQVQAFGRGTNLHAVWDTALIAHWPGGESALRAAVEDEKPTVDASFAPGRWAEESCRVVSTDGFYPPGHKLDDACALRWDLTLVRRMAAAARRLALPRSTSAWGIGRTTGTGCVDDPLRAWGTLKSIVLIDSHRKCHLTAVCCQ